MREISPTNLHASGEDDQVEPFADDRQEEVDMGTSVHGEADWMTVNGHLNNTTHILIHNSIHILLHSTVMAPESGRIHQHGEQRRGRHRRHNKNEKERQERRFEELEQISLISLSIILANTT